MIDTRKPIRVGFAVTERFIEVRWPTDQEWEKRCKAVPTIRKQLAPGKSTSVEVPSEAADLELLNAIAPKDHGFTGAEASVLLGKLEKAIPGEVERVPEGFSVPLQVYRGNTTHVMGVPSAAQMLEFERRETRVTSERGGFTRATMSLMPARDLYDRLVVRCEGYDGDAASVPLPHKWVVIRQIIDRIREIEDSEDSSPEN